MPEAGAQIAQPLKHGQRLDQRVWMEVVEPANLDVFAAGRGTELNHRRIARQHGVEVVDVDLGDPPVDQGSAGARRCRAGR